MWFLALLLAIAVVQTFNWWNTSPDERAEKWKRRANTPLGRVIVKHPVGACFVLSLIAVSPIIAFPIP